MSFRTAYGYSHSENGWRMCNRDECVVAGPSVGVPHSNTAPIRSGDASTILVAWMLWYHHNVEPITSPVWGWSLNNEVATSNHLSGTAIDINAPKYPWGARTMPGDRIAKIRRGLDLFEGCVFWGADWQRADEMHYQLGYPEGDPRIAAFARKLNSGHLDLYDDGGATPEEDDMGWLDATVRNFKNTAVSWKDILWFMDRNTSQARDQLVGADDGKGGFTGWAILGRSKIDPQRDNTLVEAIAEVRADVAEIKRLIAAREA